MVTLLYVEDDENVRLLAQDLFSWKGYIIHSAVDGLEGLEILRQTEGIEIIFTDYQMPRMNGLKFVEEVRKNKDYARYADVPIVGVGSFPDHYKNELKECLVKPFGIKDLLRCVEQYCRE